MDFNGSAVTVGRVIYYGTHRTNVEGFYWFTRYVNYTEEGSVLGFYHSGGKWVEETQLGGKMDGVRRNWWKNGNIKQQTEFKEGERHGWNLLYNENGKQILEKYYNNGKEIK